MESSKKAYHLVLVYSYGAGFFSLFNKLFGYLEKYQPIYAISWQVYNPFNAYGEGEIFGKVFAPYVNVDYKDYEIETIECMRYCDGKLTGREACRLYRAETCIENGISLNWRNEMNSLFHTYYKLANQKIYTQYIEFAQKIQGYRNQGKKVITFLLRHPALNVEQENNILPTYEMYDDEILRVSGGDASQCVLVCLTDSQEAYEYFMEKYKHSTILFPDVQRRRANETDSTYNPGGDEKIEMAMLSVLYLATGDHFIHPVSNMATSVLIINPNISHSYLIGH
jgi:hypothetical protein